MAEHSPEPFTNDAVISFSIGGQTITDCPERIAACVNACRGLNPEVVPELVACLKGLLCSHDELLERCLLHDAFLNHAQQLNAGIEGIRARELLARVKG